jgi:hypothetical protein
MSDDTDDLDAVLRRTMASLDRQAPAGYFEALPARTLARLDDPAIGAAIGAPLGDAGLQDIRELASETRARLSSRAQDAAGSPAAMASDDAAISSVSKAVAMPGPTRSAPQPDGAAAEDAAAVALPLRAGSAVPGSAGSVPPVAAASVVPVSAVSQPPTSLAGAAGRPAAAVSQPSRPAPPLSPTAVPVDASASAAPKPGRRAVWAAVTGGLAAAGVIGYLALGSPRTERADVMAVAERSAAAPTTTALSADQGGNKAGAPVVIARGSLEPAPPAAAPTPVAPAPSTAGSYGDDLRKQDSHATTLDKRRKTEGGSAAIMSLRPPARTSAAGAGGSVDGDAIALGKAKPIAKRPAPARPASKAGPVADLPAASPSKTGPVDDPRTRPPIAGAFDSATPQAPVTGSGSAAGPGSAAATTPPQQAQIPLDQLIGEGEKTPPPKPKPTRTSLSTDDIKRGMTAVAGKAKACFNGTQGLAALRLTVAPSGRVVKAAVTGMFAGSPTGACVERAAGAARFPPWDGGPQSFNYSYLLSD